MPYDLFCLLGDIALWLVIEREKFLGESQWRYQGDLGCSGFLCTQQSCLVKSAQTILPFLSIFIDVTISLFGLWKLTWQTSTAKEMSLGIHALFLKLCDIKLTPSARSLSPGALTVRLGPCLEGAGRSHDKKEGKERALIKRATLRR